ncbi:tail fiber domain-containing protein, partial [Salmonella enterica]
PMKTDIGKIDNALDRLDRIGGYTYLKQGMPEAGVIAQEVEKVLPQAVTQTAFHHLRNSFIYW